jgi:hypothetical protein
MRENPSDLTRVVEMVASVALGAALASALLAGYLAYHRIVRGNPSPIRAPTIRNRRVYCEIDELIATKPQDIVALHRRLIYYREILGIAVVIGMSIFLVAGLRQDLGGLLVGWALTGVGGSLSGGLDAYDALRTEVAHANHLLILPTAYLATGKAARRHAAWMFARSVIGLLLALAGSALILMTMSDSLP